MQTVRYRNEENTILLSDAYKYTHWLQLPVDTKFVLTYVESRGCNLGISVPYTKFYGLQAFIKDYLLGRVVEQWMIEEADEILGEVFGNHKYFNRAGWQKILDKHNGFLPVRIKAVKEGSKIPLHNALVTIENTDPDFPWLTQWLETMLLRAIWYPTTICTVSSTVADIFAKYAKITGSPEYNPFTLNDFGARGVSSHESACIAGSAHLVNFLGTDTVECIPWARRRYGKGVNGHSVMASEHSTTTIYGKAREGDAYERFLDVVTDDGIISLVVDSYDTENAVKVLLGQRHKVKILSRKGTTVFRPDSGDPVEMSLKVVQWLWEIFGGTINGKGYKVLNPKTRVIYGDGINLISIDAILANLVAHEFAVENIVFGMGGKLLQGYDRDTFGFAAKCCWALVGDNSIDVYKEPKTDSGKNSKRGRLETISYNGVISTAIEGSWPFGAKQLLITIFENGILLKEWTFEEVKLG